MHGRIFMRNASAICCFKSVVVASANFKARDQRTTLSRIAFASAIESAMTVFRRGEGRLMFSSRASLIPAMIEAAITSVEENRSLIRCSSSYLVACSRATARFISPMSAPLPSAPACGSASWTVFLDKCPEAHTDSFHCIEDNAQ